MLSLLGIFFLLCFSCAEKEQAQIPVPDIPVFQTKSQDVPIHREYVGQIFGFKDIDIRARVEGYLEVIHFKEGSRVEKGVLLYTLESQSLREKWNASKSAVAAAKANQAEALSYLNRIRPLAEQKAVSESDLDSAQARYDTAVEMVKAAQASQKAAKIQLDYTEIKSPVSGIIGKTEAKVGDFVGRAPNTITLNTVSRIDTVLVEFFITETEYLRYSRYLSQIDPTRQNREEVPLDMILVDGSVYEHKGQVDFVDRGVDPSTGALLIQASFPNPQKILRPGQFAKIRARVQVVKDGILIPQRCVVELQGLYSVYVVDQNNKVKQREIKVGSQIGQFWLVTEGLQSGEMVVYEGLQKVKDEMIVNPVIQKLQPTIEESE